MSSLANQSDFSEVITQAPTFNRNSLLVQPNPNDLPEEERRRRENRDECWSCCCCECCFESPSEGGLSCTDILCAYTCSRWCNASQCEKCECCSCEKEGCCDCDGCCDGNCCGDCCTGCDCDCDCSP